MLKPQNQLVFCLLLYKMYVDVQDTSRTFKFMIHTELEE